MDCFFSFKSIDNFDDSSSILLKSVVFLELSLVSPSFYDKGFSFIFIMEFDFSVFWLIDGFGLISFWFCFLIYVKSKASSLPSDESSLTESSSLNIMTLAFGNSMIDYFRTGLLSFGLTSSFCSSFLVSEVLFIYLSSYWIWLYSIWFFLFSFSSVTYFWRFFSV